jgi:adenosylcobinamide-phosphate synthase
MMLPVIALVALAIERLVGYPSPILARIGHPVMWMGAVITWLEARLNRPDLPNDRRRLNGVLALSMLLVVTVMPAVLIAWSFDGIFGWLVQALLASTLLAQKELDRAVEAVAIALRQSLAAGRTAVSQIVGRDPDRLDEAGVSRAAVETLAESTSDGVIAPLFWLLILGLPGIVAYKAINTADSMIGHLDARYRYFGWAAARLDDVVNWIPARLSAVLIVIAAFFEPHASPSGAWAAARADASKHDSPNAGWPEAAMAGALRFTLGGPRHYDGELVDLPSFGTGKVALSASDILRALSLYRRTLTVTLVLVAALAILSILA